MYALWSRSYVLRLALSYDTLVPNWYRVLQKLTELLNNFGVIFCLCVETFYGNLRTFLAGSLHCFPTSPSISSLFPLCIHQNRRHIQQKLSFQSRGVAVNSFSSHIFSYSNRFLLFFFVVDVVVLSPFTSVYGSGNDYVNGCFCSVFFI